MAERTVAGRVVPAEKTMLFAEVMHSRRVSPSFQRVTVTGEALRRFVPLGFDQWFRLFLPQPGHEDMRLPKRLDLLSYARFLTIPKRERPALRNYTVSGFRIEGARPELDIDFVLHGDEGFASGWAASCAAGARVAILDEGLLWVPPADTARVLWVGDETGLPALAGTLASLDERMTGTAVIEVPDEGDLELLPRHPAVEVIPVVRTTARPGAAALDHLRELSADVQADGTYAYAVGESSLATGARRHLVTERGFAKSHVSFCGYWRDTHA